MVSNILFKPVEMQPLTISAMSIFQARSQNSMRKRALDMPCVILCQHENIQHLVDEFSWNYTVGDF